MKRLSTFLLLFLAVFSFGLQAKNTLVTNDTELTAAWNSGVEGDTIFCANGTYNPGANLKFPLNGTIVVKSEYDDPDSMAVIVCEIQQPTPEVSGGTYNGGLIMENIHLKQRRGAGHSSGHTIYLNKFDGILNIDNLVFKNCIISDSPRGLFRSVVNDAKDEDGNKIYSSCGDVEYFEMSNCLVTNIFVTSGNNWPLVYFGHIPVEMHFKGNTFYNMPYLKNIFTMSYADPESGRSAKIYVENNTFATTTAADKEAIPPYFSTGSYLGEEAEFHFKNNMFIIPNWSDEFNLDPSDPKYKLPYIVSCKYGMIYAENNLIQGPQEWGAGQLIDEDGQGGFLVLDVQKDFTMEDLNFSWDDFADPKNGDYTYLSTKQPATAGTEGGPIGDPRWVKKFTNPRELIVTANKEGAVVTPERSFYEDGSEVTVTASELDGHNFVGWELLPAGTSLSTENPYTFNITADMNIQAVYQAIESKKVEIIMNGTTSAGYTITPDKEIYYVGDVITIEVYPYYLNEFLGWSDGLNELTRTETVTEDLILTANFKEENYLLYWDFNQITANNQSFTDLPANHAFNPENSGIMNSIVNDEIASLSTRNNKFTGDGQEQINCGVRRMDNDRFSNPDYIYIKFSTIGLNDLKIKSTIGTDNTMFEIQKMQYSLDKGINYTDFATKKIEGEWAQVWMNFDGTLPAAAENQDTVYIRWIPDTTSPRLFNEGHDETTQTQDYLFLAKVHVYSGSLTAIEGINKDNNDLYTIFASGNKIYVEAGMNGIAEIYTIMGQKAGRMILNEGWNEFSGLSAGIYIVRIGNQVQKVLVK